MQIQIQDVVSEDMEAVGVNGGGRLDAGDIHVGLNWKSAIRGSDPQRDFFKHFSQAPHKKRVVLCQM